MIDKLTTMFVLLGIFCLSSCAGGKTGSQLESPAGSFQARRTIVPPPVEEDSVAEANLFSEATPYANFQDLRAYRVGDLVTINIVETSKASKQAATKTSRASSLNAGIDNLLGYEARMGRHLPAAFDNSVMFKGSMSNDFDGSGSTSRNESMTAAITARVLKVLPNGNLYIEGTRQVRVNNEIQFITLSGLIRPSDISPDNTVLSSYIADAKINYTGKGPVSDKQRPGWLARILDNVWPF